MPPCPEGHVSPDQSGRTEPPDVDDEGAVYGDEKVFGNLEEVAMEREGDVADVGSVRSADGGNGDDLASAIDANSAECSFVPLPQMDCSRKSPRLSMASTGGLEEGWDVVDGEVGRVNEDRGSDLRPSLTRVVGEGQNNATWRVPDNLSPYGGEIQARLCETNALAKLRLDSKDGGGTEDEDEGGYDSDALRPFSPLSDGTDAVCRGENGVPSNGSVSKKICFGEEKDPAHDYGANRACAKVGKEDAHVIHKNLLGEGTGACEGKGAGYSAGAGNDRNAGAKCGVRNSLASFHAPTERATASVAAADVKSKEYEIRCLNDDIIEGETLQIPSLPPLTDFDNASEEQPRVGRVAGGMSEESGSGELEVVELGRIVGESEGMSTLRHLRTLPIPIPPQHNSRQPGAFHVSGINRPSSPEAVEEEAAATSVGQSTLPRSSTSFVDAVVSDAELAPAMAMGRMVSFRNMGHSLTSFRSSQSLRSSSTSGPTRATVPPAVSTALRPLLRGGCLLPRNEQVDRIVDRLLLKQGEEAGETMDSSFVTVVQGMGGLGKTTLTAMAVSRPVVRSRFRDGIAWIKLGQRQNATSQPREGTTRPSLSHAEYLCYLREMYAQIRVNPPDLEEVVFAPSDNQMSRERKELQGMHRAYTIVSEDLEGGQVLIVIDDCWNASDIDLFNFSRRSTSTLRLLVTTRMKQSKPRGHNSGEGLFSPTSKKHVIVPGKLTDIEAAGLLFNESRTQFKGRESFTDWLDGKEDHVSSILQSCKHLPVAVKNVGRRLAVTGLLEGIGTGQAKSSGIEQVASELERSRKTSLGSSGERDTELFDILDKSFSPYLHGEAMANLLRKSFCVFALVFARTMGASKQPWVPADTAIALLNEVVPGGDRGAAPQALTSGGELLNKLEILGLVDSDCGDNQPRSSKPKARYRVHHDLLVEYAQHQWDCKNKTTAKKGRAKSCLQEVEGWLSLEAYHRRFVEQYKRRREERPDLSWNAAVVDDGYVYEHLPQHIMRSCGDNVLSETMHLMCDEGFIRGRMSSLGLHGGMVAIIRDTEALSLLSHDSLAQKPNNDHVSQKERTLSIFRATHLFLKAQLSITDHSAGRKVGKAYALMGKALQGQNLWLQALDALSKAVHALESAGMAKDDPVMVQTLRHASATAIPKLVLVPRGSPRAIVLKHAAMIREGRKRKRDNITSNKRPTKDEGVSLELSSHPGLAVVLMRPISEPAVIFKAHFHQLSIGPKDSALHMCTWGDILYDPSGDFVMTSFQGAHIGDGIGLVPYPYMLSSGYPNCVGEYPFEVNEDGTISPTKNPESVIGTGPYPLVLVARNSPNRFILKHGKELREEKKLAKVGHFPSGQSGLPLELISHPGFGITSQFHMPLNFGAYRLNAMGMDTVDGALRATYDGRIISKADDGAVFTLLSNKVNEMGSPIFLWRANNRTTTRWKGAINDFVINEEGSISPMHVPNLALGCPCLGDANSVITPEDQVLAEKQSRLILKDATLSRQKCLKTLLTLSFFAKFRPSKIRAKEM